MNLMEIVFILFCLCLLINFFSFLFLLANKAFLSTKMAFTVSEFIKRVFYHNTFAS